MYIYQKRSLKNRIKQFIQRLLAHILIFLGVVFILNWVVDEAKACTLFLPRTIHISVTESSGESVSRVDTESQAKPEGVAESKSLVVSPLPQEIIRNVAQEMGFADVDNLLRLAECESTFNPLATNQNDDKNKSLDRGLFMWNSYWHADVSDDCAFDAECATRKTIERIQAGYLHEWMCADVWEA